MWILFSNPISFTLDALSKAFINDGNTCSVCTVNWSVLTRRWRNMQSNRMQKIAMRINEGGGQSWVACVHQWATASTRYMWNIIPAAHAALHATAEV